MDQLATGALIARKRKEANLTQVQLAELLGISDKSVSKWERGKCMPDYAVVTDLCETLGITVSELLDGKEAEYENSLPFDNGHMIDLLARIQRLESQRTTIIAVTLLVLGIALLILSSLIDGSGLVDFFSGTLSGLGSGVIVIGVFLATRSLFEYLAQEG